MPGGIYDPKLKNLFDQENISAKVESAEDLQKLFMDPEKLAGRYSMSHQGVMNCILDVLLETTSL